MKPERKVDAIAPADHGELLALLLYIHTGWQPAASSLAGNHDYDLHNLADGCPPLLVPQR